MPKYLRTPASSSTKVTSNSRRTFIRNAAVGTMGTALALNTQISRTAYASHGDETIKIALVGCGRRGTGAAVQALSTAGSVKLWAMADAFGDCLESSLRHISDALAPEKDTSNTRPPGDRVDVLPERRFVGLDAYRKAIDSGVDVILITGPPGFRPQHFEYAVNAGKHVFMEKPLATDVPGVHRVLSAATQAKKKNLKVGVGLQRHHQQSYQEAVRQIHDSELGDILQLRCYWNSGPPAKKPFPRKGLTELEYQVRNWYFFTWLSGDHICEQHIHNLDVCNWLMQCHPVEACGMGGRQVRTGKEFGDIFDHHTVEFTFANGTKMFSQCRQMAGCESQVTEHALGSKAMADLGNRSCRISKSESTMWRSARLRPKQKGIPYQVEHDVLFSAIRNDQPHNEAEYGALSTMTAILGRLATYSGNVVTWDEAFASDIQLTTDAEKWTAEAPTHVGSDGHYPVAVPGVSVVV